MPVIQLYTAAQSRAADARAIDSLGVSGFDLMLRAGRFALDCLLQGWPQAAAVSIYCGKGNNAGDGYVLAGMAQALGIRVEVIQVGTPPAAGEALQAVAFAQARAVPVVPFTPGYQPIGMVLVDALLGTGQQGAARGDIAAAVAAFNASKCPVLAIDLPTGLNADTGGACGTLESDPPVVQADMTATFITRKLGQYTGLGKVVCGQICFDSLGVDARLCGEGVPLLTGAPARPPLPIHAYKHQRGHVVIAGGDLAMGGAVILAGEAALRAGAGMVTLVTRPQHRPAILARRPELMVVDAEDATAVDLLLTRASCVVLGPGLDRQAWGQSLYERITATARIPVLLDADGFHHWLGSPQRFRPAIITPHVAEAARLLGRTSADVQHDRPTAARQLAERVGDVVVLKGAGSLIADRQRLTVCGAGNPSMATAGMGDVLCGIIASQLADSESVHDAVVRGVLMHASAGDRAAARGVPHSLLASDLIDELRVAPSDIGSC